MLNPDTEATPPLVFDDFPIHDLLKQALRSAGLVEAMPIQRRSIPPALEGRDIIGKAETGMGKTIAFGIPVLERVDPARVAIQALILAPTRELALQIAEVLRGLGAAREIRVALLVGGVKAKQQVEALSRGAQIVVATPGRVLDLIGQRFLNIGWVEILVLDEADRMLDMGFIDDVRRIIEHLSLDRQTLMFSATFPRPLLALARRHMRDPVSISTAPGLATVDTIEQTYVNCPERKKRAVLQAILDRDPRHTYLVFCNTKREVAELDRALWRRSYNVIALHGDLDQPTRFRILEAFRAGTVQALVATDVAARGLDIDQIDHVVNYDVPNDVEGYLHRIGRTGRAGRHGVVITLVSPHEQRLFRRIVEQSGWPFEEADIPVADIPADVLDDRHARTRTQEIRHGHWKRGGRGRRRTR